MAMPEIVGRDGRPRHPGIHLGRRCPRWRPAARPVPVPAAGVWQSAVHESCAVVIDIAGPVPLVVEGARLAALAAGGAVPGMHEDPDVWQQVAAAAAAARPASGCRLSPPQGGLDFTLELAPRRRRRRAGPEISWRAEIADAAAASLGGRVRAGIAVVIRPPG